MTTIVTFFVLSHNEMHERKMSRFNVKFSITEKPHFKSVALFYKRVI